MAREAGQLERGVPIERTTHSPSVDGRRVRVVHCVHGLGIGGAQQVVRWISKLAASDFEHFVYSPSDGVLRSSLERSGAKVRIIGRWLPKFDPFWIRSLARAMRADEVDLVHAHLFGDSLHGYLAAARAGGLPIVNTLHVTAGWHSRLQQLGYRWLLPRASRNVACCESVNESFAEMNGVGAAPLLTIWNGIDDEESDGPVLSEREAKKALGVPPESIVVGAVGRLVEQKGYHQLIRAAAELPEPLRSRVRVLFAGDGHLRGSLEREARRLGIESLVTFVGFRSDVRTLLRGFDVVAFPSICEGLPVALLEAMVAGRCVVATALRGIGEAVQDEENGLIVPVGDEKRLTEALVRVIEDVALRRRLGQAARTRVMKQFAARRMVQRYESLYRDVIGETYGHQHRRVGCA